jgi:hypothetical protein
MFNRNQTILIYIFLSLSILTPLISGAETEKLIGAPEEHLPLDSRDKKIFNNLSKTLQDEINSKSHQAIIFYLEGSYMMSLRFFQEIPKELRTSNITYYLGLAAFQARDMDLSIKSFSLILQNRPQLHRVRLDLANALLEKGEFNLAKLEIEKVISKAKTELVKNSARQLLKRLNQESRSFFLLASLTLGLQFDDNVNIQPDILDNTSTTAPESDIGHTADSSLNIKYDFGKRHGFVWNNRLKYYATHYSKYDDYNFAMINFETSIKYNGRKILTGLPLGYTTRSFSNDHLSDSIYLEPSLNYKINSKLSIKSKIKLEREEYNGFINQYQDNDTLSISIGPYLSYPSGKKYNHFFLPVSYYARDAELSSFSYLSMDLTPSWSAGWEYGIKSFLKISYNTRTYETVEQNQINMINAEQRKDKRLGITAMVSRQFSFVTLALINSYTKNQSNLAQYEYTKQVIGLNASIKWSL